MLFFIGDYWLEILGIYFLLGGFARIPIDLQAWLVTCIQNEVMCKSINNTIDYSIQTVQIHNAFRENKKVFLLNILPRPMLSKNNFIKDSHTSSSGPY